MLDRQLIHKGSQLAGASTQVGQVISKGALLRQSGRALRNESGCVSSVLAHFVSHRVPKGVASITIQVVRQLQNSLSITPIIGMRTVAQFIDEGLNIHARGITREVGRSHAGYHGKGPMVLSKSCHILLQGFHQTSGWVRLACHA